jgi:hypothetical protein
LSKKKKEEALEKGKALERRDEDFSFARETK